MKKYRVTKACHCFNRYWEEGEIAEFPKDLVAPHLFELVSAEIAPNVPAVPVPLTMAEINESNKVNAPKTGMGFVPTEESEEDAYEKKFGRKKPGPKPK